MQKCEFNSTEITLLYGYSSKSMKTYLQQNAFFREYIWGTHTSFKIEVITAEVLHKQIKILV